MSRKHAATTDRRETSETHLELLLPALQRKHDGCMTLNWRLCVRAATDCVLDAVTVQELTYCEALTWRRALRNSVATAARLRSPARCRAQEALPDVQVEGNVAGVRPRCVARGRRWQAQLASH
jgi:hypothetical protein